MNLRLRDERRACYRDERKIYRSIGERRGGVEEERGEERRGEERKHLLRT